MATAREDGGRHRRSGPPTFRLNDLPDVRLVLIYLSLLAATGEGTVSLVAAHDRPWWWLKAAGLFTAFLVLLAGLIAGLVVLRRTVRNIRKNRPPSPQPGPRT